MTSTAAHFIAETLEAAGVERVYGVAGDSLNGFTEALRARAKIEWVHMRHEEAAAFAAGAEAQLTGDLAVCAGSCGPGNLHLINGLFDAQRSGAPVLAIAAHIPSSEIGIDYFQATHPESLFKDCSHYVELVSHPNMLPQVLERAMRVAIARRGVAVVVISGDVALEKLDAKPPTWIAPAAPRVIPPADQVEAFADLLNGAKRVTLLCGIGCAGARPEVLALAEALKAPIVHAMRGKEAIEHDNPFDVGMTGFIGFSSGYAAMKDCDTLVILGSGFPYRQFYPDKAKVAQIDISPEALGNRSRLDLGLLGDVGETLRALLPRLEPKADRSFLDRALAHYAKAREDLDALAQIPHKPSQVHPQQVTRIVSELAAQDAVFTCDVGTPTVWAARYLRLDGQRRLLGSFNHGSMANALLQAIGAQSAFPGRQVVSLSGDGGFSMMMGDFISLSQLGLPVKVVVLNNAVDLQNPNFAAMAQAMGVKGVRIERAQDLEAGIAEAFAHDGPALVDVVTARQELVMPPKITLDEAHKFGVFALKAVLDGRAAELIDLAKVNLKR
jgi:pyruvate dehydrogenase (quinone)